MRCLLPHACLSERAIAPSCGCWQTGGRGLQPSWRGLKAEIPQHERHAEGLVENRCWAWALKEPATTPVVDLCSTPRHCSCIFPVGAAASLEACAVWVMAGSVISPWAGLSLQKCLAHPDRGQLPLFGLTTSTALAELELLHLRMAEGAR